MRFLNHHIVPAFCVFSGRYCDSSSSSQTRVRSLSSKVVTTHLREAEEEADPSYEVENLSDVLLDLLCAGQAGVVVETGLQDHETHDRETLKHL